MKVTLFIFIVISLTSCSVMYFPNMQNVPMFSQKGELKATATLSDLQLSYAVTNSIGLTLNGFYRERNILSLDDGKTDNYRAKRHGVDGAIAFYKVYPKTDIELLLGYGQGYASLDYERITFGQTSALGGSSHFHKYYFQPDLTLFKRREMKVNFAPRLEVVSFYDFEDAGGVQLANQTMTFFAPALTIRKKYDRVSFAGQVQYSASMVDLSDRFGNYSPFKSMAIFNLGITVHIDEFFNVKSSAAGDE